MTGNLIIHMKEKGDQEVLCSPSNGQENMTCCITMSSAVGGAAAAAPCCCCCKESSSNFFSASISRRACALMACIDLKTMPNNRM